MWILECDGNSLNGKRVWLRPGKSYLFGRTKPESGKYNSGFAIKHKSVSRKHLTISVAAVKAGDGSDLNISAPLSVKDEATKVGTDVDGTVLKNEERVFDDGEHVFKLGSFHEHFQWQPVVLSFTFPSKDTKNGKDPLVPVRSRLEGLGIKTILPYVASATTHVVSAKRNTAKCLQALVHGGYVVDTSFLDAIADAARESDLNEPESFSPLEVDFDQYWPDALAYVPAPGKEPGQRPSELFAPDQGRGKIFAGLVFVFCDRKQFDNLQAPIHDGGGKAVLYKLQQPLTTPEQLVSYISEFSSNDAATALVVKFHPEKGYEPWATKLQEQIQAELRREFVEQNEFLDAVLTKDPSKLVRGISSNGREEGVSHERKRDLYVAGAQQREGESISAEAKSSTEPVRTSRLKGPVKKAFKGFDDGFDISQIQPYKVPDDQDPESLQANSDNSRKRPAPHDEGAEQDREDALLPGTAAVKRMKLSNKHLPEESTSAVPSSATQLKSPRKELNIQEAVRTRRLAEEEAGRREEEDLHQTLSDMSFEEMNRLAKIEEMDVAEPAGGSTTRNQKASERWDPRWNGLKNFKKFRRAGEAHAGRREHTIIVPLEEVKKRGHGVGEHYWLESNSGRKRREREEQQAGSAAGEGEIAQSIDDGAPSPSHQTFASAPSHQEQEVPAELADGHGPAVIDVDEPRTTRQGVAAGVKRQASSSGRSGAGKKQRTFAVIEDSDSEDEMKFRFRRNN